jgi:soluble calcium-activated nucleotidase 1
MQCATFVQVVLNNNRQYVKIISREGAVEHVSWADKYNKLKQSAGIDSPGYITHEAAVWSEHRKKWFFLPRKASRDVYVFAGYYKSCVCKPLSTAWHTLPLKFAVEQL